MRVTTSLALPGERHDNLDRSGWINLGLCMHAAENGGDDDHRDLREF